jgi:hypothetical protein
MLSGALAFVSCSSPAVYGPLTSTGVCRRQGRSLLSWLLTRVPGPVHRWTRDSAPAAMVTAWHAGAVVLIDVLPALLAPRTRFMIGAPVSAGRRCEWASAGSLTYRTSASLIWLSCRGSYPEAECGLSSSINRAALRPRTQLHRTTELLLRRSFHAGGQAAVFLIRAGLLVVWLQLNVSGFRPVLARGWHGDASRCW